MKTLGIVLTLLAPIETLLLCPQSHYWHLGGSKCVLCVREKERERERERERESECEPEKEK